MTSSRPANPRHGIPRPAGGGGATTAAPVTGVVDAHVHLWDTARLSYPWLDAAPALPRRADGVRFTRACAELSEAAISSAVVIQAECRPDQAFDELRLILSEQASGAPVAAVVAYAPLEAPGAAAALDRLAAAPEVRGVRRNIQDEGPGFCQRLARGVALLADYGLSFDICARHHQLSEVTDLVDSAPRTSFVLDHLGKPAVGAGNSQQWEAAIVQLAERPNVSCKLSGLGTEAPANWSCADVAPYLTHAFDAFGAGRVMFGSDWPVCTANGTYRGWFDTVCSTVPVDHHEEVFNRNASRFYRL